MKSTHPTQNRRIPGDPEFWLFILADALIFLLFFAVFMYYRALNPAVFQEGHQQLNTTLGLINTLILLTSSWCVACGLGLAKSGSLTLSKRFYLAALILGTGFVVCKGIEYFEKLQYGIEAINNVFYIYYFSFTGLHLFHVLIGMLFLAFMTKRLKQPSLEEKDILFLESGGIYWHLVDILWVFLFFIIYLTP